MNEMFSMLDDANQPMYNDAKVAALLDGIEDTKYDVLKQIICQDYNITYEDVLGKLQVEKLQLQLNLRQSGQRGPGCAAWSGVRGHGGGQGGQQQQNQGNNDSSNQSGR